MSLPTANDYHIAVQNPRICFSDFELRSASVECTPNGVPRPRSGGFAVTYRLIGQQQSWAVRCFHRETPDLQGRYGDISKFLRREKPERFLEFGYHPNGINVGGEWFPIVKMDWKSATTLDIYLDSRYRDASAVRKLREEFVSAVAALERVGIAHGDLQHGNILVDAGLITFVDYDGLFVPGMAATTSNELGHVNFQSPLRTDKDFGPHLDRFSAMSIAISLEALEHQPDLWTKYGDRDNLIFSAKDYVNPDTSPIFQELQLIPSLKERVQQLILACRTPLEQLPTLSAFLGGESRIQSSQTVAKIITRTQLYQYPVIDVLDEARIRANMGNVVQIVGRITEVKHWTAINRRPMAFVNFSDYQERRFFIVAWEEILSEFNATGSSISSLEGEWVTVIGLVEQYQGRPEIVPKSMRDLRVLRGGRQEANAMLDAGSTSVSIPALSPVKFRNAQILETIRAKPIDAGSVRATSAFSVSSKAPAASLGPIKANQPQSPARKTNREIIAGLRLQSVPTQTVSTNTPSTSASTVRPQQVSSSQTIQPYVAPQSFGSSKAGCIIPLLILLAIFLLLL